MYVCMFIHALSVIRALMSMYVYACMCVCMFMYVCVCLCMYVCNLQKVVCVCMYVCVRVCMCNVCMYVCVYVIMCLYVYVCMYVYVLYVCLHHKVKQFAQRFRLSHLQVGPSEHPLALVTWLSLMFFVIPFKGVTT